MVFKSVKGMFQLQRNYRDAFKLEEFESKFIEECMDKYPYIVGDISSGILRLKGFDNDPKSKSFHGNIQQYLDVSCSFGCPFYVLKRIHSEKEYQNVLESEKNKKFEEEGVIITPIVKENFDKESLVLQSTPAVKPNIVIDPQKINSIPKGELSSDLKEAIKNDRPEKKEVKPSKPEPVVEESYVSASDDFDPSKIQGPKFNKNKNKNKNNNQANNQNQSNNQNQKDNKPKNNNKPNNNVVIENKENANKENNQNNNNNGNPHKKKHKHKHNNNNKESNNRGEN